MNWNKYPFVRMVTALVLGIMVGDRVGVGATDKALLVGLMVIPLAVETLLHHLLRSYRYQWIFGVNTLVAFALLGFVRMSIEQQPEVGAQEPGWKLARVLEPPEEREKTMKVLLQSDQGKVMAYFQKELPSLDLSYGDYIGFSVPLEEVLPPMNPMEFDYKTYLERRGVAWSVYLKSGDWMPTGDRHTNPVFDFAYRFRQRLLLTLQHCGITDDEFGVGAAILLGYDENLPAQVRKNYVAAGSMHILCVSGMHVGIIYLLASFLLGLFGKGKHAAFVKRILLLLLIWLYALITGLSPSIMRSALMISFMIFGELIRRKGFALNSIAASAFILLLINPNNLFAMGFQLSYGAVVGIVLLQKPIYNIIYVKNKWLDKAWEVTAVSLAAQVATMPFTVYYFNQFTPYFWLSNLLMTPLSFIVILTGMTLLAVSWVPWLNIALGKVVWLSLHVMNMVVAGIERLPLSLVKGLYLSDFQFGLSLLLLLLLWLLVNLKRKRMVMEMLVVASAFAMSLAWRSQQLAHQSQVVVYSLRNHTAISIVDGFDQVLLCDETLLEDPSAIDYSLKGFWAERQLPMSPRCYLLSDDFADRLAVKRNHLVSTQGKLLAFWNPDMYYGEGHLKVDYLLVRSKQTPDLKRILYVYQVGELIIDGSVPEYLAEEWIRQAESMGVPYRNVRKGALFV